MSLVAEDKGHGLVKLLQSADLPALLASCCLTIFQLKIFFFSYVAVGWDSSLAIANTQETLTVRVRSRQNSSDIKVRNLVTGQELEEEAHVI